MRRYGWLALIIGFLLVVASLWALWDQQSVSGLQTEATRAVEPLVPTVPSGTTTTYVPPPTELPPTVKPEHELAPGLYSLRQRVGVGVALVPPDLDLVLATLGVGWYLDWGTQLAPRAAGQLEYAQMVRVPAGVLRPGVEEIGRVATANPGALWLIGNEPDVIWQDNATPEQYAAAYHQAYEAIKAADPTAQVAIGGVAQPSPLRLKYLQAILTAYQATYGEPIPVDVWNVHNFILREERGSWGVEIPPGLEAEVGVLYEIDDSGNLQAFEEQILAFRRWMKRQGFQDKPLIISEYGIPMPEYYGFPQERVTDFMLRTFDYMRHAADPALGYPSDGYRLVQRWVWYSLTDTNYPTGNLVDPKSGELLPLGSALQRHLAGDGYNLDG